MVDAAVVSLGLIADNMSGKHFPTHCGKENFHVNVRANAVDSP